MQTNDEGWRTDAPTIAGWYKTRRQGQPPTKHDQRRFFNGQWSLPVLVGVEDDAEATASASIVADQQEGIEWQGLPEPHPAGYGYALALVGPFMTIPLDAAVLRLAARQP